MGAIDITLPIRTGMATFPGDPPVRVDRVKSLDRGDPYNVSALALGSHTGTHVDPPVHFVPGGATVDRLDLALLNGPCRVVDVGKVTRIDAGSLPDDLARTSRLLFRTRNSEHWAHAAGFFDDYVALTLDGAQALPASVALVGIDALSIEADPSGHFPVHHHLLGRGTIILEGLNLAGVPAGRYRLRCLPLRIEGGDGAPVRALLDPE